MLTIEELKALPIGEWVWLIDLEGNKKVYATKLQSNNTETRVCLDYVEDWHPYFYSKYGTKWLAYKNKEEAEGKSITLPYLLCTSSKFACVIWRDADGKIKKTYTMPMDEAKGVLEEKERIQWKDLRIE